LIVAVVLAAGKSTRMGKPKQLLPVHGRPMLGEVLEVLRKTKVDGVVVVMGGHEGEVRRKVRFRKEKVVSNPDYADGMSSSLKAGLAAAVRAGADAVMVVLADQPKLRPETVDQLVDAHLNSEALIVAPVYRGVRGNPVIFDKTLFPQMMKIDGDVGAKAVLEGNRRSMLLVESEDRGVIVDIDTPADYEDEVSGGSHSGRSALRAAR
jgi:molybdenum cofactor cytidylyltransferase